MRDDQEFVGILTASEKMLRPDGRPATARPSPKLVREVERVLAVSAGPQDVAEWLADYMERYAARFAHPCIDMTDPHRPGEQGTVECSLCGVVWPVCGHAHWSGWVPVDRTPRDAAE